MTYLEFLLIFLVPPIVLLAVVRRFRAGGGTKGVYARMGIIAAVALVYTTPWDNYLIAVGAWAYAPDAVLGTIGLVPIEEYCFFVLQPIATGLLIEALRSRSAPIDRLPRRTSWAGTLACLGLTVLGAIALVSGFSTYLGLILVWSGPVLMLQWAFDGALLRRTVGLWIRPLIVSTFYLWVADAIAIRSGVWTISPAATMGRQVAGLPVEEMAFFLVTNAMVVFGLVLLEASSFVGMRDKPS